MTPEQIEKAKPMLASQLMVKNVLARIQTQDRRPVKRLKLHEDYGGPLWDEAWIDNSYDKYGSCCLKVPYAGIGMERTTHRHFPPYQVGDIIYLREKHLISRCSQNTISLHYWANDSWIHGIPAEKKWIDYANKEPWPGWRGSIHMPKWAARIFLEVKRVWVERIQDISDEDARAEGVSLDDAYECNGWIPHMADPDSGGEPDFIAGFDRLWNNLYPGSWDRNDWVWAIQFKLLEVLTNAN